MYGAADQIFEEFIPQVYMYAEDAPKNVDADSELIFIRGGTSNNIPEETKSLNLTSHNNRLTSLAICEGGNEMEGCQEEEESHTKCPGSSLPEERVIRSTISTRTYSISPKQIVSNAQNTLHLSDNCDNHIEEADHHSGIESAKQCAHATWKPRAFNLYVGVTEKNIFALHNIDMTLPINCDLCHIRFYDMKSFDDHMKSHMYKRHFMCQLCPKKYVTWENLVAHRKAFHQGQFISCKDCSCRKHHIDLGPLQFPVGKFPSGCEECKEGFVNSTQLNKHYRSHVPERYENATVGKGKSSKLIEGSYPMDGCTMTEESFQVSVESNKESLTVESNSSSKELQAQETQQNLRSCSEEYYKCLFCNSLFNDSHSYKNHKMTHVEHNKCKSSGAKLEVNEPTHDFEKYQCFNCQTVFSTPCDMQHHMQSIHYKQANVKLKCNICSSSYIVNEFMNHYLNCIEEKKTNNTQKVESKIVCHICGEVCFNLNFHEHMKIHSSENFTFMCEICGILLYDSDILAAHLLTHSQFRKSDSKSSVSPKSTLKKLDPVSNIVPNYVCEYCGRKFKRSTYLQLHTRRHTGEKPYQCNQCNKTFYTSHQLTVHTHLHSGDRLYICSVCKKSFASATVLYAHKNLHSNNSQHTCSMCGKKFLWRSAYYNHMRTHSNIRPHKCEICCKAFFFKSRLQAHMNRHEESKINNSNLNKHSNGTVSYQCSDCGKTFASQDELENHHIEKCYLTMITFVSSDNDSSRTDNPLIFLDSCKEKF